MSDWDGQKRPVVLSRQMDKDSRPTTSAEEDARYKNVTGHQARQGFTEFFKNFRIGGVFHYREALLRNWNKKDYFIEVNLAHVCEYDDMLSNALQVHKMQHAYMTHSHIHIHDYNR
jgi:hypothetical protein